MYKILICDLETENKPWYGQVASPFNPENYIVAPGWRVDTVLDDGSVQVGPTEYRYFASAEEADAGADWFNVLDECQIMVCHNSMFEQKWFLSKYRTVLENFLKRGGRIACTAMGQYLISGQQDLYPSLDETAPLYGGTHKVDGVKILWEQGYLTSQIDKDLLIEYLAGPSGDIDNTALCWYGQQAKLAELGMAQMFWERCESQLAFGYCEWFGMYVDTDVAHKNRLEQEAEIARLTAELWNLLPKDMPDWVEFNFGSPFQLSALIYGGPVKGRRKVPYDPPQYVKADYYKVLGTEGTLIEVNHPDLVQGERWNFEVYKSGKNKGQYKVFREDTAEEKLKWQEDTFQMPGLVNLQTLPDVIRSKYLGKRAEYRGAQTLSDGSPVYSTAEEALDGLKNFVPEVALMVQLSKLEKDTSTYYLRAEYAKSKPNREVSIPEAVGPGESGEGGPNGSQEALEAQVRVNMGDVASDAVSQQPLVSDLPQVCRGESQGGARGAGSARPLPRDGQDSGRTVPHLQQGVGDGGRQSRGASTLHEIPRVGVNGCIKVKGMLQFVGPDSIVHHSLNTTATVTGRLSSSRPNLQNLPRSDEDDDGVAKSKVKEMFTSRFGPDGRIIEVDYSALEVVMLCAMTKDTDLLALLQANTDMHCYRLAFKLGENYASVKAKCKNEADPEHGKYKTMRSDIKPLSFADQYGASAAGLAFNTGCSLEFAEEFQANEMKLFPISRSFRQVIAKEVERTGSTPEGIHREMYDNGSWGVYRRGYYTGPSTTRYSFRQHKTWDKDSRTEIMSYKPTQMANYPFQGEAGFMMSVSMGRICRWLISKDWFNGQVCLINNVHDAAYLDAANEVVGREAALGAKVIMEDAPKYMTRLWPEYDMADIPFPAAAEMGPSMFDKTHVE